MKCLDSDLLVAILRGDKDAKSMMDELDAQGSCATTSVNAFEITYGASMSRNKASNLEAVKVILQRLEVIPLDLPSSQKAGEVMAGLSSSGEMIDFRDALIAGIALENGLTLLTRNKKHFARISKLKVESW